VGRERVTTAKLKRIASLFFELAEAFHDLADEGKPVRRVSRERTDRAAEEAVRQAQEQARKRGIKAA
jgi:hypothetical protein